MRETKKVKQVVNFLKRAPLCCARTLHPVARGARRGPRACGARKGSFLCLPSANPSARKRASATRWANFWSRLTALRRREGLQYRRCRHVALSRALKHVLVKPKSGKDTESNPTLRKNQRREWMGAPPSKSRRFGKNKGSAVQICRPARVCA